MFAWRKTGYEGVSATSKSLLHWWFQREHLMDKADGSLSPFRYYIAQREAVETVIWLYEARRKKVASWSFEPAAATGLLLSRIQPC